MSSLLVNLSSPSTSVQICLFSFLPFPSSSLIITSLYFSKKIKNFPELIESIISPNPPYYSKVGSQFSFFKNDVNEAGVDKIFLYENMGDFVEYMSQKVGQRLRLRSLTVSPKRIYRSSVAQWASRINQEIRSLANLPHSSAVRQADYEISDDLYASLRKFMSSDFELYETLKNSLKPS